MEQLSLFKGELMEELLRNYFLSLGYYVARGVKFKYENTDLTDIDLFLYNRSSSLTRNRINVDIKNKKSPQALERIIWTNGMMRILNFDSCIVATTDCRPLVHSFAQAHNTTILDGTFLNKLKASPQINRLSEDELISELAKLRSTTIFNNKDWRFIYESSKSKLLSELDFSGFNSELTYLIYFIETSLVDVQKREFAIRMSYIIISHLLIIMDFILKDIAYLEKNDREKRLSDGLKFGNLGEKGVDMIISMAIRITGNRNTNELIKSLDSRPVDILKDFFSKNENTRNLFTWAKDFENKGFARSLTYPIDLDLPLRGVISVLLDFISIERKRYFQTLQT